MLQIKSRRGKLGFEKFAVGARRCQALARNQCGARHQPAAGHRAEQFQIRHRHCGRSLGLLTVVINQPVRRRLQRMHRLHVAAMHAGKRLARRRKAGVESAHLVNQRQRGCAFFGADLAADQVVGLDAGGAFINGRDARIAQILRSAGLFNEAHAAMDLHAGRGDFHRNLGAPALDHRRQQVKPCLVLCACLWVRMMLRAIEFSCRVITQRAHRFGLRLHRHQHAPHIRVDDDRIGWPGGVFWPRQRPPL